MTQPTLDHAACGGDHLRRGDDHSGRPDAAGARDEDAKTETATLHRGPSRCRRGAVTIDVTYTGILNDKLRGFYLSTANGRKYAVSQMEATDARRAFPSFDEPAYKATFDISLTVAAADTAISNGRQMSDTPGPEPGTHTVTFATTPKMSTYLVAMLVGDFVCRERRRRRHADPHLLHARQAGAHRLRAPAPPSSSWRSSTSYFGIKYPFGKLDIIAVPDFAAGAMENAGAITFRERAAAGGRRRPASVRPAQERRVDRSPTRSRTSGSATW